MIRGLLNSGLDIKFTQPFRFLEEYQAKMGKPKTSFDTIKVIDQLNSLRNQAHAQKEELQLFKSALSDKNIQIEKLKSEGSVIAQDIADSRLHLAFMFASPLIRTWEGETQTIMQLDCQTEIEGIVKVCSELKYELKYKSVVATPSNMRNVMTDRPVALHFSGHGIDNTLGYTNGVEDKGKILLLEDETSMAYHLYEQDLKDLIQASQAQLEVVFVASCQSQFAGEAFLHAGAKHVI